MALLLSLISTDGATDPSPSDAERLMDSIRVLSQITTGQKLLKLAQTQWGLTHSHEVVTKFRFGDVSRTDAVLTRHFSPSTGKEVREREVTIYLRRDQGLDEQVLDIAHELTHATSGPSWDPYDPELTAASYIRASLEAPGGEVDALVNECRVASELENHFGRANALNVSYGRCRRYRTEAGLIDRERVVADFYRVGPWKSPLQQTLGADAKMFRYLSGKTPQLYSSTGQAPYPVALLKEYGEITDLACRNSRKRLVQSGVAPSDRKIASQAERFVTKRCR